MELAAEESVFDDPMFAPEVVKAAAAELHAEVVAAWTAADRRRLAEALGHELLVEWEHQLDEFRRRGWRNVLKVRGRLRVRFVGLVNRPGDAEDRVVVHLRVRMWDVVYDRAGQRILRTVEDTGKRTLSEYWTLGKRDGRWILVSVEQQREGAYHLDEAVIPSPWTDDRLHDDAVIERGIAAAIHPESLAGVTADVPFEFRGGTRVAALDLAQFDGRYAPDVLESAARRAVAAWAEAIDGNHQPLITIAGRHTAAELLYPEGNRRTRLVIRGPRLERLRIVRIDPAARPPTMTVEAAISARRYLEHRRTTAVLSGNKDRDVTFTEQWDLALTANPDVPWRIASRHRREETTTAMRIERVRTPSLHAPARLGPTTTVAVAAVATASLAGPASRRGPAHKRSLLCAIPSVGDDHRLTDKPDDAAGDPRADSPPTSKPAASHEQPSRSSDERAGKDAAARLHGTHAAEPFRVFVVEATRHR